MTKAKEITDRIERFLEITPLGPVQDADCLDICAYLLGECGLVDRALEIYELCLLSPSTIRDHLSDSSIRYLALAERAGATTRAVEMTRAVLTDLMQFGMPAHEIQSLFFGPASEKLSSAIVHQVRRAIGPVPSEKVHAQHVS
jgi:hypothetical protein